MVDYLPEFCKNMRELGAYIIILPSVGTRFRKRIVDETKLVYDDMLDGGRGAKEKAETLKRYLKKKNLTGLPIFAVDDIKKYLRGYKKVFADTDFTGFYYRGGDYSESDSDWDLCTDFGYQNPYVDKHGFHVMCHFKHTLRRLFSRNKRKTSF